MYTHIKASLVNGQLQVVAWNPITQMGMAYRLGSDSVANADRPFKVDYQETKRLNSTIDGFVYYGDKDYYMRLYSSLGSNASSTAPVWNNTEPTESVFTFLGANANVNQSGGVYVDYFFGNSEYKKLVNYAGTGIIGNEFKVGFTPSRSIHKPISATGDYSLFDIGRNGIDTANDEVLYLNLSSVGVANANRVTYTDNSIVFPTTGSVNASGVSFIAIVEADTDKSGGGIIFPFVTDDNNLLVTDGGYIYTDGKNLDGSFNKTSEVVSGVQSFDLTGVSDGEKYLARVKGTGALLALDEYPIVVKGIPTGTLTEYQFSIDSGLWYDKTSTPLSTPISFISRYPYMVVSGTPHYEMKNEKAIPVNIMDSLQLNRTITKTINVSELPTADPFIDGELWNNSNVITLSVGA